MKVCSPAMLRDARGAVFAEKLIVYLPLLTVFFVTWELAELAAAKLVVQRASSAAGRAAVVVLPDDPVYYDDEPTHSYGGKRREDIELAAGMILSSIPRLTSAFVVDVSDPPSELGGSIDVTVTAPYDCGAVSLLCGGSGELELTATTSHAYQSAKYVFGSGGGVGGGSSALVGSQGQALTSSNGGGYRGGSRGGNGNGGGGNGGGGNGGPSGSGSGQGNGGGLDHCPLKYRGMCMSKSTKDLVRNVLEKDVKFTSCKDIEKQIREKTEKVRYRVKCISEKEAIDKMAEDFDMREREKYGVDNCRCTRNTAQSFKDSAKQQIQANKCRQFTSHDDQIYVIKGPNGECNPSESDILHETIHVMSGHGGKTPFQGKNNDFNEALTQIFTEEASTGKVDDAYTEGDAGAFKKCLKELYGEYKEDLCKTYFLGDEGAFAKALVDRVRGNLRNWEKNKPEEDILKDINSFNLTFWKTRVCPKPKPAPTPGGGSNGGPSNTGGGGGFPPPPPPPPPPPGK